ncbi:ribose-5-phosphate isomerase B [Serratia fonticola]|uniref:Ribose-5-phosphate isomerase B n=1 Tax=Serratia fonticola TaxID=47917 RepID=A0A4U9V558_SERFO|nr:ribose-5-phosphate isomerase B [Serratia fonticola]
MQPIAIGADDAAIELKNVIVAFLQQRDIPVTDYSPGSDTAPIGYPDIAFQVAQGIKDGKHQRGIFAVWHRYWHEHCGQQGSGDPCGTVP